MFQSALKSGAKLAGASAVAAGTAYYARRRAHQAPSNQRQNQSTSASSTLPKISHTSSFSSIVSKQLDTSATSASTHHIPSFFHMTRSPAMLFSPVEEAHSSTESPVVVEAAAPSQHKLNIQQQHLSPEEPRISNLSSSKIAIDDGYEQLELPCRVFPDWKPMDESQITDTASRFQYYGEHVLDFLRNRVDDMWYAASGEYLRLITDAARYEVSYQQKHPGLYLSPYYEAIYRGWYDSIGLDLLSDGNLTQYDYEPWLRMSPRPLAYFDFYLGSEPDGAAPDPKLNVAPERVVIQLYYDMAPSSVVNFIGLCEGFVAHYRYFSYNNSKIHRIDHGHAFFGGDVVHRNGQDGMAFLRQVGKRYLADESSSLRFDTPGCVAFDKGGANTTTSHFFITQKAMPELDDKYTVFGHVVDGLSVLEKINNIPTNDQGVPLTPVRIVRSGVLIQNPQKDDPYISFREDVKAFEEHNQSVAEVTPPPSLPKVLY